MTTPKPVVTREHRTWVLSRTPWPEVPDLFQRWAEGGMEAVDAYADSAAWHVCRRYQEQAQIAAEAEARAAKMERLRAMRLLSKLEQEAHNAHQRMAEAALYDARLRISGAEHINASDDVPTSGLKGGG